MTFADLPAVAGRYLLTLRITDFLDVAIMAYVFYRLFWMVRTTKAASLLKGLFLFLALLALSTISLIGSSYNPFLYFRF